MLYEYITTYTAYVNHEHSESCYSYIRITCWQSYYDNAHQASISFLSALNDHPIILTLIVITIIVGLIYLWLHSYELTVTDKRVYGKVAWDKRVDLPIDSISAISTTNILKGITVATSSGRISFLIIKNADKIYSAINNLLIERQNKDK